ncbi:MAG: tetratricopeptide repeat protein [Candidatus Omnitrophica bacterium]|nr:tetratricopeptide repeat protein [Candidatus Omnitrophota bacterium]
MIQLKLMKAFLVILLSIFPLFSSLAESLTNEEAKAYREEGYKVQSLGDFESALVYYQKAVILDPQYAQAYNDLGIVYETLGDNDRALEMYKKVLKIDPEYLPAYTNLAFIYERKGDMENAAFCWQKRYKLGRKGDYWWEVSRQRLLKSGLYPEMKRERLEKKAVELSKKIIQSNEQGRLKLTEAVELHFNIGNQAFLEKDYETAKKEFETVFFLNPPDEEILNKSISLYKQSRRLLLRKRVLANAKNALDYIENEDYLSAQKKLRDTLEVIFRITQEK